MCLKFPRLEELQLTIFCHITDSIQYPKMEDDCCNGVKAFLGRHKEVFVGGKIPKVRVTLGVVS